MNIFKVAFVSVSVLFTCLATAQQITADSRLLAECEFTYSYVGQLMQLRNNEGAAKAMIRRSSMLTTANFMLNEERGVIAGWKIREFTLMRDPLKRDFDNGRVDPLTAATKCDRNATPIAIGIRNAGKTLWGKSFDELQIEFFERSRKLLGI